MLVTAQRSQRVQLNDPWFDVIPLYLPMAEIGLIASIIGVADAGAKTSLTLFRVASELGFAAYEIRLIAADTNALLAVLTNLSAL